MWQAVMAYRTTSYGTGWTATASNLGCTAPYPAPIPRTFSLSRAGANWRGGARARRQGGRADEVHQDGPTGQACEEEGCALRAAPQLPPRLCPVQRLGLASQRLG